MRWLFRSSVQNIKTFSTTPMRLFCFIIRVVAGGSLFTSFNNSSFAFTTWVNGQRLSFRPVVAFGDLPHYASPLLTFDLKWEAWLVTLPFTWILRGPCRAINWPNFNTVESQGTERLRRWSQGNGWEWGAVRTHTFSIKFDVLYGCSPGCPANNYSSNIKNHRSQFPITNRVKSLRHGENCQNATETHSGHMLLEKWHQKTCLTYVATNLQFVEKTQYLQNSVKWALRAQNPRESWLRLYF